MAEYYSKEAVVEFIRSYRHSTDVAFHMEEHLYEIPAADVVEVVRCKDCKWTKTDGMDDPAIYCVQWDMWETPSDGFCWLGEKREES